MDNLTHSLFALTLARTRLGRVGRGATLALVVASNAPDIDAVSLIGGTGAYLRWHRGPTHGLLGIAALGWLTGVLVWGACRLWTRRDSAPPDARLGSLIAISSLAVLCHILMDLPTSYGTRLLSPFDWHWVAVDWIPIVDIYLLAALAAGLIFGRVSADARRRNAMLALVLMGANYSIRGVAHHRAIGLAPRLFGDTLPAPCGPSGFLEATVDYWPRPVTGPAPGGRRCLLDIAAMPTFASPFRWRVVAHTSSGDDVHDIDVTDPRFLSPPAPSDVLWRTSVHVPNIWTPPVVIAAGTVTGQTYLGFSRFPAARTVVDQAGITVVRWTDARFLGGPFALQPPGAQQPPGPFGVEVRLDPNGRVLQQTFVR